MRKWTAAVAGGTMLGAAALAAVTSTVRKDSSTGQRSPASELDDRIAIRGLVEAYGRHADRREPGQQARLFAEDGRVTFYGMGAANAPIGVQVGHAELKAAFATLKAFDTTTHLISGHTVTIEGDRATGETACMAYHVFSEFGQRMLLQMAIRNFDVFVRQDGRWYIAERKIIVDWTDRRPSQP